MDNQIAKDYDKESSKKQLTLIQTFLKDNQINNAKIQISSTYYNQSEGPFHKDKSLSCSIKIPVQEKEKAKKLREKLAENPELAEVVEIDCALGQGSKFQTIEGADKAEGDEENIDISHTPGTVLLVDFWATWCGPCQQPMAHNQEMLVKNEAAWKDKVSIVGLSLDSDKNTLVKRINDRGWKKVDQYILPGNWKHPGPQMYGCNGIPHVLLVDKEGTIVHAGHPSSIDLESKINELIAAPATTQNGENKEESSAAADESKVKTEGLSVEDFTKIRKAIKEGGLNSLLSLRGSKDVPSLVGFITRVKTLNNDLKVVGTNTNKFVIRGAVLQSGQEKLQQKIKDLGLENVDLGTKVLPTTKLTFGSKCSACSKALTNTDPQYYSPKDKVHFCKECGEKKDDSKVGTAKFVNPNALIYLSFKDPSLLEEVLTHRIGEQQQPKTAEEEAEAKVHPGVGCDICGNAVGETSRWKCLNCADFDICGNCIDSVEKGDASVIEKINSTGAHNANHVLQRFCFGQE